MITLEVGDNLGFALIMLALAACIWAYRRN